MTATATETYPAGVSPEKWNRLTAELRAADSRESASAITGTLADMADETAKALRVNCPEPGGEGSDPAAWTDIATWLRLISAALDDTVHYLLSPDHTESWEDVPEGDRDAWFALADAEDRTEWAAAWSALRAELEESAARPSAKERITALADSVMNAPW